MLLAAPAASAVQPPAAPPPNPFFQEWKTPFGVPPFDQIRTEHFLPAIEEGIAQHDREVEAIAKSPAPPTFANTVEALDASGRLLEKVSECLLEPHLGRDERRAAGDPEEGGADDGRAP